MKPTVKKTIAIAILVIESVLFMFLTPPANYGEWAVRVGCAIESVFAWFAYTVFIVCLNWQNGKIIFRNILFSTIPYLQIVYGVLTYTYGLFSGLMLPIFQIAVIYLVWVYEVKLRNKVIVMSSLLLSALWAISLGGHLYYYNISNDAETMGIFAAEKIIAIIFILTISVLAITIPISPKRE